MERTEPDIEKKVVFSLDNESQSFVESLILAVLSKLLSAYKIIWGVLASFISFKGLKAVWKCEKGFEPMIQE